MSELTLYEKRLAQALDCPKRLRRRLLGQTRQMAEDFTAGKPDASWDEVEQFLGDPQELAQTMLESMDQKELIRYRSRKLWLRRILVGFLIAVFLAVTGLLIYVCNIKILNPPVITETQVLTIHETEDMQ